MAKIDRLGWAAGVAFDAYGTRIGVRTNEPDVLARLEERFPPGWKPVRSPRVECLYSLKVGGTGPRDNVRRYNLLYENIARLARTMDLDEAIDTFESRVKLMVAVTARTRVIVHAGVVGWRGRAIVVPGRTFTGKTTLIAELVRAGATYYSDDFAVLDGRGRVHPYAQPLAIRDGATSLQRRVPVAELGGGAGTTPLPVGLVVLTTYRPGATWRPRRLSPGKALLELLASTGRGLQAPETVLARLGRVAARVPVVKGVRGDARGVAARLLSEAWPGTGPAVA